MKKIIVIFTTIILVVFIFFIYTSWSVDKSKGLDYCIIRHDVEIEISNTDCPDIGQTCSFHSELYQCGLCCLFNTIYIVRNTSLILAIICFILFILWKIFKNKFKKEEIGIIAKTLLFLGIIALILFFFLSIRPPAPIP